MSRIQQIIAANRNRVIRSRKVIYVRGDDDLRKWLNSVAKRLGCSANELAMAAIQVGLESELDHEIGKRLREAAETVGAT